MRADIRRRTGVTITVAALALTLVPGGAAEAQWKPKFKAADDGAKITAYKWKNAKKRQFDFTIKSPALKKSVKARVLLPKRWSRSAKRTWPVVYAFHGGHDNYTSWTRMTKIEELAAKWDVIVVMPEGDNGSYTNWYNYGKGGTPKWENFHLKEVVQLMQRNYRAGSSRAAIGNSSGGQGAMTYAARFPGAFKYVASFSGLLHLRAPGIPAMLHNVNSGNKQDANAIWGEYPKDIDNWKQHNPYDLASRLRGTEIFFSSGTSGKSGPGDPQVAPWDIGLISEVMTGYSDQYFADKLKRLKIKHTADLYGDGRHNWPAWRRELGQIWSKMMKTIHARRY